MLIRMAPLLASLAAIAALGCATQGVTPHEYLLGATAAPAATEGAEGAAADVRLGVGPVKIPAYLDRPNIVTRIGENELAYSDLHRWGEPLDAGIARVVAANLASLVPTRRIETHPWRSLPQLDHRVTMEIERFERGPDGRVTLELRWFLADGRNGRVRLARQSKFEVVARSSSYPDTVAAMSEAAALLSAEIADAIRRRAGG